MSDSGHRTTMTTALVGAAALALVAAGATAPAPAQAASRSGFPAAGAKVPDKDPFYRAPKNLGTFARGAIVRIRPTTADGYGAAASHYAYQIAFRSNDTHNHAELAVTTLIVPSAKWTGKGARPIVSLQEPEDSTGTQCSPSYTIAKNTDMTGPALVSQLTQDNYAIAVPDHEGPLSEFLGGREEGHVVLDGIRAVDSLGKRKHHLRMGSHRHPWGLTGYSGGANATSWAAQLMPSYAPHLKVVGAATGGTPADPVVTARYIDGGPFAGFEFGAALGVSLAYPEAKIQKVLNAQGKADFKKVNHECEADILEQFGFKKLADDSTVPDPLVVPSVAKALRNDTLGFSAPTIPIFDYHANTDEIVPVGQDDTLVKRWCGQGTKVQVLRDQTGEHIEEALVRAGDAATYLEDRFAGKKATNDCGAGRATEPARAAAPSHVYVALGDSYSSAPQMKTTVDVPCSRSDHNYAHLIIAAAPKGAVLRDRTCKGASTHSMTHDQQLPGGVSRPPQLRGLTADTQLVTVGIGANDDGFFSAHILGCADVRHEDPTGAPCRAKLGDPAKALAKIQTNVGQTLRAIQQRAPKATIVEVGYPQIVPASGTCDALPLATGDYPFVRHAIQGVVDAQRRAASAHHVTFVDMVPASAGHDICSTDPWVDGRTAQPGVAAAYHPFAVEQRAVADAVIHVLRD